MVGRFLGWLNSEGTVEALKELLRLIVLTGGSVIVNWVMTLVSGIEMSAELVGIIMMIGKAVDKYIHKEINKAGLTGF